jgi:hypothetical protein
MLVHFLHNFKQNPYLNVVAHLVDGFEAVLVSVLRNEFCIVLFKLPKVEVDFLARIFRQQGSTELNNNRLSYTEFALNVCLNAVYSLPKLVVCSFLKGSLKLNFIDNIHLF